MIAQNRENTVPTDPKLANASGGRPEIIKGLCVMAFSAIISILGVVKFNAFSQMYVATVIANEGASFDPNVFADLFTVVLFCFAALGVPLFYFGMSKLKNGRRLLKAEETNQMAS